LRRASSARWRRYEPCAPASRPARAEVEIRRLLPVADAVLRSSRDYELIPFDRLDAGQKAALSELARQPEFYGLLCPRRRGLCVKTIDCDGALLLLTLESPGPLPAFARQRLGDGCQRKIAALILDGLLEIETEDGFAGGPAAHQWVLADATTEAPAGDGITAALAGAGPLARLSLAALRYAAALELDEPAELADRLYYFHRCPASAQWRQRYPDAAAVATGLRLPASIRALRGKGWVEVPGQASWRVWSREERGALRLGRYHKLYVSPRAGQLPETFAAVAATVPDTQALALKVGRDVYGVLRPDKLVVYFVGREALAVAAERLLRACGGVPAQGVPFTCALDPAGLMSWAVDPPSSERLLPWQRLSWRQWVTERLAAAVAVARATPRQAVPAWQFAVDRLDVEGVDTANWSPGEGLWE
jgi:hypothetical protein